MALGNSARRHHFSSEGRVLGASYGRQFGPNLTLKGFSLIEMMAVVAIILIVAAIAIPSMSHVIDSTRIRGTLGSVSNLAQMCRTQAVKQNTSQRLFFSKTITPGSTVLYVKAATALDTDPILASDPQLLLPSEFSIAAAPTGGTSQLTGTALWGSAITPNAGVDPYFNSRGLPCLPDATGACSTTSGFVYYFSYNSGSSLRWSAISISPAGRIKTWFWNGTAWGN